MLRAAPQYTTGQTLKKRPATGIVAWFNARKQGDLPTGVFETIHNIQPRARSANRLVSASKVTGGKSKGGYETLRQTRVVERSRRRLHRHYCGLHVGTSYVLILFSSSDQSLFDGNLKEVEKLVDSWDASGAFPTETKREEK